MENFDIIANLPIIFFSAFFIVVFILFIIAEVFLLRAKKHPELIPKGKKILTVAFSGFFSAALFVAVFYFVSFLLQGGEVFRPDQVKGEMPPVPDNSFPSGPNFYKIGNYYFNGPFSLQTANRINSSAIYAVLCKIEGEYEIVFIDQAEKTSLLKEKKYGCWVENCDGTSKDLYVAILWTPKNNFSANEKKAIFEALESEISPICSFEE